MIYIELTKTMFKDEFHRAGRGDQFSSKALGIIYDYLTEDNEPMRMDVIEICCDFAEESIEDALSNYNFTRIEQLEEFTHVLYIDSETVLYQPF